MDNLYIPSTARKFLENMRMARREKSIEPRYLSQKEVEEKLDAYIRSNGEVAVNKLRDEMRELAPALGLEKEFQKINSIISAMLQTHEATKYKVPLDPHAIFPKFTAPQSFCYMK